MPLLIKASLIWIEKQNEKEDQWSIQCAFLKYIIKMLFLLPFVVQDWCLNDISNTKVSYRIMQHEFLKDGKVIRETDASTKWPCFNITSVEFIQNGSISVSFIFLVFRAKRLLLIHCLGWQKSHSVISNNFIDILLFSKLMEKVTRVYICFLNLEKVNLYQRQLVFKHVVLLKMKKSYKKRSGHCFHIC